MARVDENKILEAFQKLRQKRRKVGVLLEDDAGHFDRLRQYISIDNIILIDIIDQLLVEETKQTNFVLGAFYEYDFHIWLSKKISKIGAHQAVICSNLDAFLATFDEIMAMDFFSQISGRDYNCPIILVTAQGNLVRRSGFPDDRTCVLEMMEET